MKWLARIELSECESQHHLHFHDNKVLPTTVGPDQARAEKEWWYDPRSVLLDVQCSLCSTSFTLRAISADETIYFTIADTSSTISTSTAPSLARTMTRFWTSHRDLLMLPTPCEVMRMPEAGAASRGSRLPSTMASRGVLLLSSTQKIYIASLTTLMQSTALLICQTRTLASAGASGASRRQSIFWREAQLLSSGAWTNLLLSNPETCTGHLRV